MALEVTGEGYVVDTAPPVVPESALSSLNQLLVTLPNATVLTDMMKTDALVQSYIPDSQGVWPGKPGYFKTYDIYFAAIRLLNFLQAQPVVRQSSSEGTSVAVDAPNWAGLIAYFRSMSPIMQASGSGVLSAVNIPGGPHVKRVDMRNGGDGYDDVDTDLS